MRSQEAIKHIVSFLDGLKIDHIMFDEFMFGKNYEKIINCIERCSDEKSKHVYTALLGRRLEHHIDCKDLFEGNQYFAIPDFCEEDFGEVYVDLGAYVGDTLEKFLFRKFKNFKTYYAFEPDGDNYAAMMHRINRLEKEWNTDAGQIVPVNCGVGLKSEQLHFSGNGSGAGISLDGTGSVVSIVALDEFFQDKKVSTIKADIESYEYAMFLGAERVLRRDKPKLAISIYHSIMDLYNIMDWVDRLDLGYQFWVRHHGIKFSETVMYAVAR